MNAESAARAKKDNEELGLAVGPQQAANVRAYKMAMNELTLVMEGFKRAIGEALLPSLTEFARFIRETAPPEIRKMRTDIQELSRSVQDAALRFQFFGAAAHALFSNFFDENGFKAAMDKAIDDFADGVNKMSSLAKAAGVDHILGVGGGAAAGAGKTYDQRDKTADKIAAQGVDTQIQLLKIGLQEKTALYEQDARNLAISENEKNRLIRSATEEAFGQEMLLEQRKLALYDRGTAEYAATLNKMTVMKAQHSLQMIQLDMRVAQQAAASWESMLQPIQGAWDSQLRGLIEGTTTWANAMRSIVLDLVTNIIKEFERAALAKAALGLAEGLGTAATGGLGGMLFGGLTKLLGFEKGLWEVPQTMPAIIHPGEMIVPRDPETQLRSMFSGSPGWNGAAMQAASGGGSTFGDITIHNYGAKLSDSDVLNALARAARNKNQRW
jgi:hypothetical protein